MSDLATREVTAEPPRWKTAREPNWRSWLRRRWPDVVILVLLGIALGFLHADGMGQYPARFDDEGTYMAQAWAVSERFDLSNYTYWYDHPPLGWIFIAAYLLFTGGLGRAPYGVAAGREMMLGAHLLGIVALYVLARRLGMRRALAAGAVALYGLSPLGIFYHRMVLLDNLAIPLVLGAWALMRSSRTSLAAHTAGAAAFATAVLIKETMLLFLPALAYELWRNTNPRNRRFSLALAATTFVGMTSLYPLFAILKGELMPGDDHVSLLGTAMWQLSGRAGSGSIFDPSSPANAVVSGWLGLDAWLPVAGVVAASIAIFIPRLRAVGATLLLLAVMLLRSGYLPVMFVAQALPLLALSVVGVVDEAFVRSAPFRSGHRLRSGFQRALTVGACALLVVAGSAQYTSGWEKARNLDADRPFRQAQEWLTQNVDPETRVLADHSLWLDMVLDGHPPDNVTWYYKLDTDPGVDPPGGWRGFDLIVTTEVIRTTTYELPQIEAAIENSRLVTSFGQGESRVEVRRVEAEA